MKKLLIPMLLVGMTTVNANCLDYVAAKAKESHRIMKSKPIAHAYNQGGDLILGFASMMTAPGLGAAQAVTTLGTRFLVGSDLTEEYGQARVEYKKASKAVSLVREAQLGDGNTLRKAFFEVSSLHGARDTKFEDFADNIARMSDAQEFCEGEEYDSAETIAIKASGAQIN